jgi:TolB-like protein/class 3 adenylate cyclase
LATETRAERRLAAVLAADVAGYSRLMGADEEGTHSRLMARLREVVAPNITEHRGRIVKNTGDGVLAEFPSVVDAVRCAVEIQRGMAGRNTVTPLEQRIEFRVGINLGDVIAEGEDIFGDGVNIAARLEALAEPGGVFISHTVHEHVRDRLPFAFDDLGDQHGKNIARPVRVYRVRDRAAPIEPPSPASSPALPLPDKPSIAVLPFANMSGDPDQEYFADGMVEEITTALSRIRWLFVIARNSTFTYKDHAIDIRRIGRELGVRYVLEGSVRKAGTRVRITGQLIDALTGMHLWAGHFDGSLEDIFELQDQIALSVAGVIEPALQAAEIRRSAARATNDLSAYDLYLRALASFFLVTKKGVTEALGLLEQAIAIDRHYAPALSWAAQCHLRLVVEGWTEEPQICRREASDLARQALRIAEHDPAILASSAQVLARFGEDISAMIGLVDRALALNPSYARGWFVSGLLRVWAGQPDLGIEHVERSVRLSPRERIGSTLFVIGMALFFKRQFDEAASRLLASFQDHPSYPQPYRFLAACYAHMGRLDQARAILERLRAITPLLVPNELPWRKPEHRELLLSGLRLAMCEAG